MMTLAVKYKWEQLHVGCISSGVSFEGRVGRAREYSLCIVSQAKWAVDILFIKSLQTPQDKGIILILQMRALRFTLTQ